MSNFLLFSCQTCVLLNTVQLALLLRMHGQLKSLAFVFRFSSYQPVQLSQLLCQLVCCLHFIIISKKVVSCPTKVSVKVLTSGYMYVRHVASTRTRTSLRERRTLNPIEKCVIFSFNNLLVEDCNAHSSNESISGQNRKHTLIRHTYIIANDTV